MINVIHRKVKAQITVMAALVFMIVISFVTTCVNAAAMSGYNSVIKQACSLSDESVFTAYSNDMLKEYDIFALKKSDIMNEKIYQYIETNLKTHSKDISLETAAYTEYKYMTDNGGYGVEEQIVRYMISGGYADIIHDYNSVKEKIKQSDSVSKVTESIVEVQDKGAKCWRDISGILKQCSRISDKESDISERVDTMQDCIDNLEKEDDISVNTRKIINHCDAIKLMSQEIKDISGELYNALSIYEEHLSDTEQGVDACYEKLEQHRSELGEELYSELAEDIADMDSVYDSEEFPSADTIRDSMNHDMDVIADLLNKTDIIIDMSSRLYDMGDFEIYEPQNNTEEDVMEDSYIEDGDMDGEEIDDESGDDIEDDADNTDDSADDIEMVINDNNNERHGLIETIDSQTKNVQSDCTDMNMEDIVDDYDKYLKESDSSPDAINSLKRIYRLFQDGIAGYVIDGEISDKEIDYDNLARSYITGADSEDVSNISIRSALINEYILLRFYCYSDYIDDSQENSVYKNQQSDSIDRLLDYETEYILCGNESDKDNLNEVLMKLSMIREGVNLAYLITDTARKGACFTLAAQLTGFTGNAALIKAVQYLIMSIWAYAESITELRQLYTGESIAIVKHSSDWITDIDEIINVSGKNVVEGRMLSDKTPAGIPDKKTSEESSIEISKKASKGMSSNGNTSFEINKIDYAGYMRVLLLMTDRVDKNAGIMSAMELVMMAKGHKDFRLREYIYEASGMAVCRYVKNGQEYRQKLGYSYVS